MNLPAIAPAPDWLIAAHDAARARTGAAKLSEPLTIELDDPGNVSRARQRLKDLVAQGKIGTRDVDSDTRVYQTICEMKDLGVSRDLAVELVNELYIPHCIGEYDAEWIEAKANNAYQYGRSSIGVHAAGDPAVTFKDFVSKLRTSTGQEALLLIAFADLMANDPGPVKEIVRDMIERGIPNFLVGHGGANKSRLALQMGMAIASGEAFLGRHVEPCPLVYVSSEDDQAELSRRSRAMRSRLGYKADNAFLIDRKGKPSALAAVAEGGAFTLLPFHAELTEVLKGIQGHKFLVIDSCLDFVQFIGRAKIDEGAVNAFIKTILQNLCDDCDCTLLIIWHTSQSGKEIGAGWSVAWENAPRSRLLMKADEDSDTYQLSQPKRNHGPRMKPITLRFDRGALLPLTEIGEGDQMTEMRRVVLAGALELAGQGTPIQVRKNSIPPWLYDRVAGAIGQKPALHEIMSILAQAARDKHLVYKSNTRNMPAGYYPHPTRVEMEARAMEEESTPAPEDAAVKG